MLFRGYKMAETCKICELEVKDVGDGVCCDFCDQWFHASCVSIPDEFYNMMDKVEVVFWFCETDKKRFKNNTKTRRDDAAIRKSLGEIYQEIKSLSHKMDEKRNMTYALALAKQEDCNKLEAETQKALGHSFQVFQPKPILPQLIITNLSREYTEDELLAELKSTNAYFTEYDRIKIVHSQQKKNDNKWTIFLQANTSTFRKLLNRYITLDFSDHYVKEYIHTLRCLNCQQYGHKAAECCSSPACARCAGEHKTNDCQKNVSVRCINCVDSNLTKSTKLDTNHSCGSTQCK